MRQCYFFGLYRAETNDPRGSPASRPRTTSNEAYRLAETRPARTFAKGPEQPAVDDSGRV